MGYNEFYISFNHIFLTFILFYSRDTLKWQSRFVYGEGLYLQKGIRLFASVLSAAISGMEVCPVQVEADVNSGLPCFTMVGFPSTQVKEAQDRVRTALKNNGISLPPKKVTVNLAPADLRKEGAGFDLPVAAAVLAASLEAALEAVEPEAALQADRAPAVTPLMAAAAAIFRKPLREILFIAELSFFS